MATLNWPGFGITEVSWALDCPANVNVSTYSGARMVAANPWHGKFSAKVTLATQQGDGAFQAIRAFFTQLQGQVNNFHLPATEAAQNSNSGVTVRVNAAQGASSMSLTGLTTAMVAGNMITVNGQLLSLTSVGSMGSGIQTVNFQPRLRAAATATTPAWTARPYALVALTDSSFSWDIASWRRYGLSFSVEEDVGASDGADPLNDAVDYSYTMATPITPNYAALAAASAAAAAASAASISNLGAVDWTSLSGATWAAMQANMPDSMIDAIAARMVARSDVLGS